jgi:glycosyltransferase involved in cell wall biosynthesis
MTKLTCLVPAYNEEESLPRLWEKLGPILARYQDWELIVVNDGSTDKTEQIVKELSGREPRIKLITFRKNRGKSAVLTAGFKAATGDRVVTLDADLQDDPEEIPRMLELLDTAPADMVGGWKKDRHDPIIKKISSKVFNWLANRIMNTDFRDTNCGLKAYRREVVESLNLYGDLYRFIPILAVANGFSAIETPVTHHARQWGKSKYGLRLSGAFDLVSLMILTRYRLRPLHFFGSWGVCLFLIGAAMLIYLAVVHFMGQAIGNRPLLTFGMLFVVAGLQLFFTGLLADLVINRQSRS